MLRKLVYNGTPQQLQIKQIQKEEEKEKELNKTEEEQAKKQEETKNTETSKPTTSANEILAMQNLSMIAINNKRMLEKENKTRTIEQQATQQEEQLIKEAKTSIQENINKEALSQIKEKLTINATQNNTQIQAQATEANTNNTTISSTKKDEPKICIQPKKEENITNNNKTENTINIDEPQTNKEEPIIFIQPDKQEKPINNTNSVDSTQAVETKNNKITNTTDYIQENYKDLVGNTLDNTTIEFLNTIVETYAQQNENIDTQKILDMGVKLAQSAETKGLDKINYIQSRIVDFASMQETNPNMSLEEMNKELAIKQVNNSILESIDTTLDSFFDCEAEDIESLLALTETALILSDEEPTLKTTYIDLQTVIYNNLAQSGELTAGEYYEYIKDDLTKTFPGYTNFSDSQKEELTKFVNTLSPEQVQEYQNLILNLPSCENENYQESLNSLLNNIFDNENINLNSDGSFDIPSTTSSKYVLNSQEEQISFEDLSKTRLGVEFDADKFIQDNKTVANINGLTESVIKYNAINEIFTNATTQEQQDNAVWQAINLISGSTDDAVMTTVLQEITGNKNLSFDEGKLITESQEPASRSVSKSAGEESNEETKSTMQSILDFVVERGKSYINFTDYEDVDFNDLSSVASYVEKTLDGFGNLAVDSSIGTGAYGMWTGAAIHSLTAVAGLVSDLNNPNTSAETALADFGSKMAQAGLEAVFGKYGETIGKFVGTYASKMCSSITSGFKSLFNGIMSLSENFSSISSPILTETCERIVERTLQWQNYAKSSIFYSKDAQTLIKNSLDNTIYGNSLTKKDIQGVLFRKLMDTSTPEYYSVGAALKGIKTAYANGAKGAIKLTSNRYTNTTVSLKDFAKQLSDVKKLRNFITKQGGTKTPVTVLRGETEKYSILFKNMKINGKSIDELRQLYPNSTNEEFYKNLVEMVNKYGATTESTQFVGTSLNAKAFLNYIQNYNIRFKIACPEGTQGAFIENLFPKNIGGYVDTAAAEFILQAGSKFNITNAWISPETGALCFGAEVVQKTVDAAGNAIWKKVAAVVIPLSLAALSASATTPQSENNSTNVQNPPEQPSKQPNNEKPNENNNTNNSSNNNYNNLTPPNNNNNITPPTNTPTNNTPNINSPNMPNYNTPNIGSNNSQFNHHQTDYNGGNVNDYKPHSTDSNDWNKSVDDIIKEQTNELRNNAINALKAKYGADTIVDVKVTHTIDEDGNITYHVDAIASKDGQNNTNQTNGNEVGSGDGNKNGNGTGSGSSNGNGTGSGNGNGTGNGTGSGDGVSSGNGTNNPNSSQGNSNNNDAKAKAEADAQLQAGLDWTKKNFTDADGNFDGDSFAGWVNDTYGEGQAYNYTGSGAQNAYNAALNAQQSGNWDNFYNNAGSYNNSGEDWSWTGFDVFSVGGGWDNPWYSGGGITGSAGGGGDWALTDEDENRFSAIMIQQDCR